MAAAKTTSTPRAKAPSAGLLVDVLLGWFIPGAGHLSRGYRQQGMITLGVVLPLFALGLFMSDFEAVSRDLHPYAFWAELGVAGGTLPLLAIDPAAEKVLPPDQSITKPVPVDRRNDTGVLFCCVAGLLNFLALFDLLDRSLSPPREPSRARREPKDGAEPSEPEGSPA